jgi:hypothetical protein
MDPMNNPVHDLFDFDAFNNNAFDDNGQDIRIIADQHLFDNGSDVFGAEPAHLTGQAMAVPHSNTRNDPSTHVSPQGFDDLQIPHQDFFNDNLELFADKNLDAAFVDFGPVDQPVSQFMVEQFGENFGLSIESAHPIMPKMPNLTIERETMLNQAQPSPQIVLATFEEQQQWQAFKSQQTQLYQSQPHTPRFQQMESSHQWGNVGEVPGPALQSPFESPTDELFQDFPDQEALANPQQTTEPLQQDLLSDGRIHLLHNAGPEVYIQPSVEFSPTITAFPHGVPNAEFSPRSRTIRGRRSRSSRTSTPEQTPQLAGLSFVSLEDAEAAMPSRYIESAWEAPSDDPSIPTTQKKRAEYVLDMFEAFQDCSECKDNKNGKSYVKRWLGGPGSYYNLLAMEKVCWHMLDIAERLHNEGPESTNMYCEEAMKKLKASHNMTFQQRIYHVCAMLKYSKFACDQLMKGEGLEALVGAPKLKMSGAATMQVQNQKRQKWIIHGRTEDPHHSMPGRNEANHQDEHEEVQPPQRKTKTKQTTKRPAPAKPRTKPKTCPANTSHDAYDEDEEAVHRRQSDPSITQAGYSSDIEIDDEPQQVIAAVLRVPTPIPQPSLKPQPKQRESCGTVSVPTSAPLTSPVIAPASSESPPAPSSPSPVSSTPSPISPKSPKATPKTKQPKTKQPKTKQPKTKQPKRAASSEAFIPRTVANTGCARFRETRVDKEKAEKMRKKRETLLATYRAGTKASARETQLAPSTMTEKASANKGAATTTTTTTNTKTKSATRKRLIDLTETDSEDEQPALKAKRPHTTKDLLAEWMIRNGGSNEDNIQEAGYDHESGRLSDAENSDSDEGSENDAWTDKKPETNIDDDKGQGDDDDVEDDKEIDGHQDDGEEDVSEHSGDIQSERTPEEESEHSGEDISEDSEDGGSEDCEDSGSETSSPSPSPIRKHKIEKAAAKGIKTSRHATKAECEASKRKQRPTSTPEPSKPEVNTPPAKSRKRKTYQPEALASCDSEIEEIEAPPPKRTKRNDGSTRKYPFPEPVKQTPLPKAKKSGPLRDVNGKFIRPKATPESSPEPALESNSESESGTEEIASKSNPERKKSGPLRDAKGKFICRKRK